jgi:endonuclease/exonuclease/phosphatase family metal-dependent hydrolase
MAAVDADIWVLTETILDHAPTTDHRYAVFSPAYPERRAEPERWVGIWSRWPIELIETPPAHRRGSVAAIVTGPGGPIVVYGTVLAWANEPQFDDGSAAKMWEAHRAEIDRQGSEWVQLRSSFPGCPLVVAGDFNQDRDGSGWYGTSAVRSKLTDALSAADLACVTAMDAVSTGLLASQHLVDHICVSSKLAPHAKVRCWEAVDETGQRLSDHPAVAIDLFGA